MTNQARVGIFSAASIIIFVLGFYFLKGVNLFERKNSYYAVYDRVDGLYKSNLVEINGFPVGRVGDMKRDHKSGKIVVRLDLDHDLKIPDDSLTVASLFSTDFLGTKKIKLVLGESDKYLTAGDTINTFFKQDLTEQIGNQIDPIMAGITEAIPSVDSTINRISWLFDERNPKGIYSTKAQVDGALMQLNRILASNSASLQASLKSIESITANIEKNNGNINVIVKNAAELTDSLQQANLKQTIENLNNTITQLKLVLTDLNQGQGSLGKIMKRDDLYNKVDSTVSNLNSLLKDVKARPYRYINVSVFGAKKHEERIEKKYDESAK